MFLGIFAQQDLMRMILQLGLCQAGDDEILSQVVGQDVSYGLTPMEYFCLTRVCKMGWGSQNGAV